MIAIEDGAFWGCGELKEIVMPEGVTVIGRSAFSECNSLNIITIPESVTSIGEYAFAVCGAITSITIPNGVTAIGNGIFGSCVSLNLITIPDGVTDIGESSFHSCTALSSIELPDSIKSIGKGAFENTAYYNNEENWENGVLYIDNYLIDVQESITGKYEIKGDTTVIADYAFYRCKALDSVIVPVGVICSWCNAFLCCDSLESITFLDSNTVIFDSEYIMDSNIVLYGYEGSSAQAYAKKYSREFVALLDVKIEAVFTDSSVAKLSENTLIMTAGTDVEQLLTQTERGAVVKDSNGNVLSADAIPGTGMVLILSDDRDFEISVIGDTDGDGKISAADARLILRASVGLENPEEWMN